MLKAGVVLLFSLFAVVDVAYAGQPGPAEPQRAIRPIPGLTAADSHPEACVSCHVQMPDIDLDARLSTALQEWQRKVPAKVMEAAENAMGARADLKARHPPVTLPLERVPSRCMGCHELVSTAPPFDRLVHLLHYQRGEENHFVSVFGGECTLCHKMDLNTGVWRIPDGSERQPASEALGRNQPAE